MLKVLHLHHIKYTHFYLGMIPFKLSKESVDIILYLLQLGNHDDMEVLHQAVQIRDEQ